MKLYVFEAGKLLSQKQYFTFGTDVGKQYDVPVPFLYIDHPKGKVLFDTGNALEVVDNKHEHWGAVVAAYDPVMTKDQWCVNALKKAGCNPEDIDWIICSHLHLDHAGGVGLFPNAKYVVQREELYYAYVPDSFMRGAYIRKDYDKPVNWHILHGWEDNMFDLFGDGSIVTYFTPGHTPGSICLLDAANALLFTGDTLFAAGIGRTDFIRGDARAMRSTLLRLGALDAGLRVLPGHGASTTIGRERATNPLLGGGSR